MGEKISIHSLLLFALQPTCLSSFLIIRLRREMQKCQTWHGDSHHFFALCLKLSKMNRMRRQVTDCEKIVAKNISDELIQITQKTFKTETIRKKATPLKNVKAKDLNRSLTKEDMLMANMHMERFPTSYVIWQMQI